LLLVLASAVILGSESHGTYVFSLLSRGSGRPQTTFLNTEFLLNDIYRITSHLKGNKLPLHYKDHSIDAFVVYCENHTKHAIHRQNAEFQCVKVRDIVMGLLKALSYGARKPCCQVNTLKQTHGQKYRSVVFYEVRAETVARQQSARQWTGWVAIR
jgi:hypothetical protein